MPTPKRSNRTARRAGFTLIELMIVVAIVGILAAIGLSAYGKWIKDARISEAQSMMADIRSKQEAYYNTWGSYLTAGANPTSIPSTSKGAWDTSQDEWKELGIAPSGGTYWQYETVGGTAGTSDSVTGTRSMATSRDWFWVEALGDLDSDSGTGPTQILVDSQNNTPTFVNKGL